MMVTLMLLACLHGGADCAWFPVRLPPGTSWWDCTMHWQQSAAAWAQDHPARRVAKGRCRVGPPERAS